MSVYTAAKNHLEGAMCDADAQGFEPAAMIEALVVLAVHELSCMKSKSDARTLLEYELGNLGSDLFDIQKRV